MTTRAVLKAEILDDLRRNSAGLGTQVLSAISQAIQFYQPRRFFFNESRAVTFPTVASTGLYTFATIGTEFYRIDAVTLTDSGGTVFDVEDDMSYAEIESLLHSGASESRPTNWAYIDRSMRMWPTPDAVYTVRPTGHIKAAEPASDGEASNVWMVEAYELIRSRATKLVALHVLKDMERAAIAGGLEREALGTLQTATHLRTGTGRVTPTEF